jgi:MoxR-like ATPase
VRGIASLDDVRAWRADARNVHADDRLKDYVVDLVGATRTPSPDAQAYIERGASPRATLAILRLARAKAFLENRTFVLPDDVRTVALPVLRHRIAFSYRVQAEAVDSDALVRACIAAVPAP